MQVVIDKAIERNPELLERVQRANAYLEPRLGRFKNDVETLWTTPPIPSGQLTLRMRFTDEFPVESSDSFSADILRPDRYAVPWLSGVVNKLFGRRADAELTRLRQMLADYENNENANGA